jgi:hypothetical protein
MKILSNEPPRWRWATVRRLGTVNIKSMQCCCGRLVWPSDFETLHNGSMRVVCPSCHADVLHLERRPNPDVVED